MAAAHEAHGLYVFCLAGSQLRLQGVELRLQDGDIVVQVVDIFLDVINVFFPVANFRIKGKELLQSAFHVLLIGLQCLFLFLYFLLHRCPLPLQSTDRGVGICGVLFLCLCCFLLGGGLFFLF